MVKLNCEESWNLFNSSYNVSELTTEKPALFEELPDRPWFRAMLIVAMVTSMTFAVVGSIGNLLGLATLIHQFRLPRRMRHVEKMTANIVLIMNLCLADLCYSCISLPNMFYNYKHLYNNYMDYKNPLHTPIMSHETCELAAFMRYTNGISEWTILGLMALERCVNIYRFQRKLRPSKWFTPRRTFYYCLVIWTSGITLQIPTLFGKFGSFGYNEATLKCDFMPTICNCDDSTDLLAPRLFFFTLETAVPCVLILVGYVIIINQVYNRKTIAWNNSLTTQAQISMALRRSKTTRLIVMLLTVFLVCIIPICVFNVAVPECELSFNRNQNIGIALYCIYWTQYVINSFIYVFSNEKYRQAYKQLCCFLLCKPIGAPPQLIKFKLMETKSGLSSTTNKSQPRLRIRTPSETVLEEEDNNNSIDFKNNSFNNWINLDNGSNTELPILMFSKTGSRKRRSIFRDNPKKIVCPLIKTIQEIQRLNNSLVLKSLHLRKTLSWNSSRMKKNKTLQRCRSLNELKMTKENFESLKIQKSLSADSTFSIPATIHLSRRVSL